MKQTMKRLTGAALALAGALVLTQGAQAAITTFATGDLMMGFSQTGNANELVFDLGSITSLTSGETWSLGSDVTSVLTNGNGIQWGAVAANASTIGSQTSLGHAGNTLWVTTSSSATAPIIQSSSSQGVIRSNESGLNNTWKNQTANTTYANGLEQASNGASSWTTLAVGNGAQSFGLSFNVDSATTDILDLYMMEPGSSKTGTEATLLGTFTYNSGSGTVTYNVAATPEPSTYALIGAAGLLLLLGARRRIFARA
jgi:hypothetical protein